MSRIGLTVLGLLVALVLTLAIAGIPPLEGLRLISEGAFGGRFGIPRTLVRTTPLLLCGLGMAVAWRSGMYNVGGEGQYVLGGLFGAAAAKGLAAAQPGALNIAIVLASVAGGAVLASFAGWLQVKRGVQCVISTILLNFIVLQALAWAVRGPLQESQRQLPLTEPLPNAVMFQRFDSQSDFHTGIFLAFGVALALAVVFGLTKAGFVQRLVGQSQRFARANRIDPGRVQIGAMALSGALCGLAGGIDYLGVTGQIGDGFSQSWGFLGIPVALLGGLNVVGVVASSVYFGALMAGSEGLSRFNATGTTLVYVIQAVAVLVVVGFSQRKRKAVAPDD